MERFVIEVRYYTWTRLFSSIKSAVVEVDAIAIGDWVQDIEQGLCVFLFLAFLPTVCCHMQIVYLF